jgi:hypothetical protein
VGTGEVDRPRFFDVLREKQIARDLMIEREAGENRIRDIDQARARIDRESHRAGGTGGVH